MVDVDLYQMLSGHICALNFTAFSDFSSGTFNLLMARESSTYVGDPSWSKLTF